MSNNWYLYQDNRQKGPFSLDQLQRQVTNGEVNPTDLVWKEGVAEGWTQAGQIQDLSFQAPPALKTPPPPGAASPILPPPSSPKVTPFAPALPPPALPVQPEAPSDQSAYQASQLAIIQKRKGKGPVIMLASLMVLIIAVVGILLFNMPTENGSWLAGIISNIMGADDIAGNEIRTDDPHDTESEDESTDDVEQKLSEDRKLIATYLQDNRLIFSDGTETVRFLTDEKRIANLMLAPCGQAAIFLYDDMELWAVNLEGDPQPFPLVTYEHLRHKKGFSLDDVPMDLWNRIIPESISWINECSKIAFNTAYYWDHVTYHNDLWVADLESGLVEELLTEDFGGKRFAYSPDGSKIFVATSQSVSVVDAKGSGWQEILTFPFIPAYDYTQTPQPVWFADSSYGLIIIPDPDPLPQYSDLHHAYWELPRNGDIWKLYPDGEAEKLFSTKWSCVYTMTTDLLFSPDRRYVLHHAGMHLEESELNFLDTDGTAVASFSGVRRIYGWNGDNKLIVQKADESGLFLLGVDQSIEALEMPHQFEVYSCKAIGPNTYLVSGRQSSSDELSLWQLGIDLKPQLIEGRIDSCCFDGLYLD